MNVIEGMNSNPKTGSSSVDVAYRRTYCNEMQPLRPPRQETSKKQISIAGNENLKY